MNHLVLTYLCYLIIAVPTTVWVARTLSKHGRHFLVDTFGGDETIADSVNHLLVVGFYLVNIGFVALYLKMRSAVTENHEVFEAVAAKIGVVLLVLGAMHFFNLYVFTRIRRRALLGGAPPPVPPAARVQVGHEA